MPNDVLADIEAALALTEQPTPKLAELVPVTKALTELRGELAAAIQAHTTTLSTLGVSMPADSVVKQIRRMHEEVSREILYCHQYSKLGLYLDTDRTDTGLQQIPPTHWIRRPSKRDGRR
jgi:hypothetical protein